MRRKAILMAMLALAFCTRAVSADEPEQAILTGQVYDVSGAAYAYATLAIYQDGDIVGEVRPDADGVYSTSVDVGAMCDIRAVSDDGQLIGWAEAPFTVRVSGETVDLLMDYPAVQMGKDVYPGLDRALAAATDGAVLEILRMAELRQPFSITNRLAFVPAPEKSPSVEDAVVRVKNDATFVLGEGGDLTVRGFVFSDYTGNAIFELNGADAELTVENSIFRNIEGTNKWSGAIAVRKGRVTVSDTEFDNCRATGLHSYRNPITGAIVKKSVTASGGAVYLAGTDCELTLDGGAIVNCFAQKYGGGVYARDGSRVNVKGDLVVRDNSTSSANGAQDNLYFTSPEAVLTLVGPLDGQEQSIGVRYLNQQAKDGFGNGTGDCFAVVGADVSPVDASAAARAFFSDIRPKESVGASDETGRLLWVDRPGTDHQLAPDDPDVVIRVIKTMPDESVVTGYYGSVEHAFAWIDAPATVTLLKAASFVRGLLVSQRVTLTAADPSIALTRRDEGTLRVLPSGKLTVARIVLSGAGIGAPAGFIYVDGGLLTLQTDAVIEDVQCDAVSMRRAGGAVSVWNGGIVTLESGSVIRNCVNGYRNEASKAGYGGGLLADNATLNLFGGIVTGCRSRRGAGVFAGSSSTVNVSGNPTIRGNRGLDECADNLCVSDDSRLFLVGDGALTGDIGFNEGKAADTNVFGRVSSAFGGTSADMQASAHCFTHDVRGDIGLAVSDGRETLLVWSEATDEDGVYSDGDGNGYVVVEGAPYSIDVPPAEQGLVYDGTEKVGVRRGIGLVLSDHTATDAGDYVAKAKLKKGFSWKTAGQVDPAEIPWSIERATYRPSVIFTDVEFAYDGLPKTNLVVGVLPDWLTVTYEDNIRTDPGTSEAKATIFGEVANYHPVSEVLTAKLVVIGTGPGPEPEPPAQPLPIAFTAIRGDFNAAVWTVTFTQVVETCWYSLYETNSLADGFRLDGVRPVSVRQATSQDVPAMSFERPSDGTRRFWRVVGEPSDAH